MLNLGTDIDDQAVVLSPEDLSTHLHVVGASGKGKSRLLEHMIRQHIRNRQGVCVIDPHGTLYEPLVKWCASTGYARKRNVHLIDPNNRDWSVGINPLRNNGDQWLLHRQVDATVNACAEVWGGEDTSKTPLLKKCLRAVFYALAANNLSLAEALELTSVGDTNGVRKKLTSVVDDEVFQSIWDEFNALRPREFGEQFSSTNNRLTEFLAAPGIRAMLGATSHAIDLQACMDQGDIVLINLQPKYISEDNARLIGTLVLNTLMVLARQRSKRTADKHPFYLYVDECYKFLGGDIESMLDESRKMGLHVVLSHQRLSQLTEVGDHIYNAVMTNAQTKIVFGGLSEPDAEVMGKEILRSKFDLNRPKDILDKPVVVDHEIEYHQTMSVGRSKSTGNSTGSGHVTGISAGATETLLPDGSIAPTALAHSSMSDGNAEFSGTSSADGISETQGMVPMLRPKMEWLPTAVESLDEQVHRAILTIKSIPKQSFLLKQPDQSVQHVAVPQVDDTTTLARRLERFVQTSRDGSPYTVTYAVAEKAMADRMLMLLDIRSSPPALPTAEPQSESWHEPYDPDA